MPDIKVEQKNVDHALTVLNENNDVRTANKKLISDFIDAAESGKLKDGEKITLLQTLMFISKQYILNPDRKKLKDFL